MANNFQRVAMAGLAVFLALPTLANAQDINLANGGADQIWKGTAANTKSGAWMDLGDLTGDGRRDLVVGAPGVGGVPGTVFVLFGGPERSGEISFNSADAKITSSETGNLFGTSTAVGNILNADGTNPKNLAIGAPGALGGRGAVYLYPTGWTVGTTRTQADATLTVLGAPGDALGSALATGDLDKDGYRELIIGAPGNNRVYIIKGGPSLSGTINLATTAASARLDGVGGGVLIAGDITGDGIYDLLIGNPAGNVVYGYVGSNGTIPTTPLISFSGVAPGDEAGASVRLLDMDADGADDLVIGAPGGDGPANGRSNAGNVYVFFGPVAVGPRSLSEAAAVFYGGGVNFRAGEKMATGDINRDTPNDLVILASGGAGGAGELDIYYGRSRSTIGTLTGGTRVVDMSAAGQVNRHIFGDPSGGAIGSVQVYEVTGEGARDVIVGVPSIDVNAGRAYFTISPRLKISRATETLVANKGANAVSSSPITVTNPSVVTTGWQATSPQPWLTASPSSGSVVQSTPGAFYIVAATSGLTAGAHQGTMTVSASTPDLTMSLPIAVTLTVTDARLAIDTPADGATVSNGFVVGGWAVDLAATSGTGVSKVEAYAFPTTGGSPIYLGAASYGGGRPDVGSLFGSQFTNSGYALTVNNLSPGASYHLGVFVTSAVSGVIATSSAVNITLASGSPGPGTGPIDPNPTPPPDPGGTPPPPPPGAPPVPGPNTRVTLNRTSLTFGALNNGALRSGRETVTVGFTGGAATWSVASDATWLNLSPASGSGAGTFGVTVNDGTYPAGQNRTATLTVTAPGVANSPLTVTVTLRPAAAGANPVGLVDTPADNATGIVGALPVTGWALDDIGISHVSIWRDPVAGEPASSANGKVFIGYASTVEGARPDVEAAYDLPFDYQAGWGYMLLTNVLPNQGNGMFRIYVYGEDLDGHTMLLGSRTFTADNANATKPFGSIDTPDQGGTINGSAYINFGWALTPQPNAIPTDGSTITVFIDGVAVGHPVYNNARSDISSLFPGRANSNGAVGYFVFDTTTLANGAHTIAWGVVDNGGNTEGLGSRFFNVLNGASSSILAGAVSSSDRAVPDVPARQSAPAAGESVGKPVSALDWTPILETPAVVQSGYTASAPVEVIESDGPSAARVKTEELGLIRVAIGPPVSADGDGYEGYMVKGGALAALPAGSFLDRKSGEFFWQPGPGFVGSYDFVFVRTGNGAKTRARLSVDIAPHKHDNEVLLPSRGIRVIK